MASKPFTMQKHTTIDKSFDIEGPEGFRMTVDFDDVDHASVNNIARNVVRILNEQWPEYIPD
jgi:hypothetical protein